MSPHSHDLEGYWPSTFETIEEIVRKGAKAMHWPLVGIGATLQKFMLAYREVFCREAGYEHVSRYINGLLLSTNKTLQGIYAQIVWPEGQQVSRRAMHESVFESGWNRDTLMQSHRRNVAPHYPGRGRAVIGLDWTLAYHPYGYHRRDHKPSSCG